MLVYVINSNISFIFTFLCIVDTLPGVHYVSYMFKLLGSVLCIAVHTLVHQDKPRNPSTLYNLRIFVPFSVQNILCCE